jgi:hypothetical protein
LRVGELDGPYEPGGVLPGFHLVFISDKNPSRPGGHAVMPTKQWRYLPLAGWCFLMAGFGASYFIAAWYWPSRRLFANAALILAWRGEGYGLRTKIGRGGRGGGIAAVGGGGCTAAGSEGRGEGRGGRVGLPLL